MTTFAIEPAGISGRLEQSFARLDDAAFADALWTRRLDVWTADRSVQERIANRLGWLEAIAFVAPEVSRLRAFADAIRGDEFTDVVLLGMGGSSLAPEVLRSVLGVAPGFPEFHMLDSVDPDAVRRAMRRCDTSLFVLASKSGSTIEPNAMAAEARRCLMDAGHQAWATRFVAITDQDTALHRRASAERFRDVFINPADIGGRYSALSFFGMVPAALMGIDLEALLAAARSMEQACRVTSASASPGLALGAFMAAGAAAGRDKLTLVLPERLRAFGLWVEQLVAESTGKQNKGIVPIAGEPLDADWGSDRLVVVVATPDDPGTAAVDRARAAGAPVATLQMPDAISIGAEFLRWEIATATAGMLMGINPFDEPNVQQAKDATRRLLDAYATQKQLPTPEPHASAGRARLTASSAAIQALSGAPATSFLSVAHPSDYVALLAYVPPDEDAYERVLQEARAALGAKTRCATMFGYGPRYLHSTGQLHKGGPNNGVFIIITAEPAGDLPVPGEPFSFGVLEQAQAIGDFQSLERAGRRALLVHLPTREPVAIKEVLDRL